MADEETARRVVGRLPVAGLVPVGALLLSEELPAMGRLVGVAAAGAVEVDAAVIDDAAAGVPPAWWGSEQ